jgi:hypothetical protein
VINQFSADILLSLNHHHRFSTHIADAINTSNASNTTNITNASKTMNITAFTNARTLAIGSPQTTTRI